MPGAYTDERQVVANVLDGLTVALLWPDTNDDPPEPTGDPATPATYVVADVEYDAAEFTDFGGGSLIRGRVVTWVWAEKGSGDNGVRALIDTLRTLFAAGDDTAQAMQFFPAERVAPAQIGGEGAEWYGRRVDWPFIRTR